MRTTNTGNLERAGTGTRFRCASLALAVWALMSNASEKPLDVQAAQLLQDFASWKRTGQATLAVDLQARALDALRSPSLDVRLAGLLVLQQAPTAEGIQRVAAEATNSNAVMAGAAQASLLVMQEGSDFQDDNAWRAQIQKQTNPLARLFLLHATTAASRQREVTLLRSLFDQEKDAWVRLELLRLICQSSQPTDKEWLRRTAKDVVPALPENLDTALQLAYPQRNPSPVQDQIRQKLTPTIRSK